MSGLDEKIICQNIKKLRQDKNITLERLAELTGFTKGYLSRIENSEKSPPISTLDKIAGALGVDITYFFASSASLARKTPLSIVRSHERLKVGSNGTLYGYVYEALGHKKQGKKMEPYIVTIDFERRAEFKHDGEEFFFVLEGKLEFVFDNQVYILEQGDSAYFDASIPHSGRSLGHTKVKLLMVTYSYRIVD